MSRLRYARTRRISAAVILCACAVLGLVVGWSTFESGGLEEGYRRAIAGGAIGLAIGLVLILSVRTATTRRARLQSAIRPASVREKPHASR